ncbi:hypothetical protein HUJ04_003354, partial [Dendroctonus ponderosae]
SFLRESIYPLWPAFAYLESSIQPNFCLRQSQFQSLSECKTTFYSSSWCFASFFRILNCISCWRPKSISMKNISTSLLLILMSLRQILIRYSPDVSRLLSMIGSAERLYGENEDFPVSACRFVECNCLWLLYIWKIAEKEGKFSKRHIYGLYELQHFCPFSYLQSFSYQVSLQCSLEINEHLWPGLASWLVSIQFSFFLKMKT